MVKVSIHGAGSRRYNKSKGKRMPKKQKQAVEHLIDKKLNHAQEPKVVLDYAVGGSYISSNASTSLFPFFASTAVGAYSALTQGVTFKALIGNRWLCKEIEFNFRFLSDTASVIDSQIRVLMIRIKKPIGGPLILSDILHTSGITGQEFLAPYNIHHYNKTYTVEHDEVITITNPSTHATAGTVVTQQGSKYLRIYKKYPKGVEMIADNSSNPTYTDVTKNLFQIIILSSQTTAFPTYAFVGKSTFTDS